MEIFDVITRGVRESKRYDRAVRLFREKLEYGYDSRDALIETANETNVMPYMILAIHEADEASGSSSSSGAPGWTAGMPEGQGGDPATGRGKKKKKTKGIGELDGQKVIPNKRERNTGDSDQEDPDEGDKNASKDDGDEKPTSGKKMPSFKKSKDDGEGKSDEKDPPGFEEDEGKRTNDLSTFAGNEKDGEDKTPKRFSDQKDDDIPVGKTVVLINPKERDDFESDDDDDGKKNKSFGRK